MERAVEEASSGRDSDGDEVDVTEASHPEHRPPERAPTRRTATELLVSSATKRETERQQFGVASETLPPPSDEAVRRATVMSRISRSSRTSWSSPPSSAPPSSAPAHGRGAAATTSQEPRRRPDGERAGSTDAAPTEADVAVVLGRAIPRALRRAPTDGDESLYSHGLDSITSTGTVSYRVNFYVDEVAATTPAAIVWSFAKNTRVQLSAREPLFVADKGFYGTPNNACTVHTRPYYAINVVRFRCAIPVAGADLPTVDLVFRLHYDDNGSIRSRFELSIVVNIDEWSNVTRLVSVTLRLQASHVVIGTRRMDEPRTRTRSLPELMFTPQIFQSISRPEAGLMTWTSSRKMFGQTWARLSEISAGDWERYTLLKAKFHREYAALMRRGDERIGNEDGAYEDGGYQG